MLVFAGSSQRSPPCNSRFQRPPLDFSGFSGISREHCEIEAAGDTLSRTRRQERLYHSSRRDYITAARDTLSPRHETLYHCGTTHSITAARHALSPRHETNYHGGTRDCITAAREIVSRRHERLYHGGTRHCITAAGEILSRRQARLYHDHSGRRNSITAVR